MHDDECLVFFRFNDEEAPKLSEDGDALEIPLSTLRKMADWIRRYDLRPRGKKLDAIDSVG